MHGRCDLACDYCYVYEMLDQRWRNRPRAMSRQVVDRVADRIFEYAQAYRPRMIHVVLHGGEPLLAGPDLLSYCIRRIRDQIRPPTTVRTTIQTNGVRLDRGYLELFRDLDVRVAVSLDGGERAHDRHRRDRRGRGSYPTVSRALRLLGSSRYQQQFAGLLCTVDLTNDPVEVYESLLDFRPPAVDLLLPHGSWTVPPPGRDPRSPDSPYGRWLAALFDRWYDAPRLETRIRLFEELIRLLLGRPSRLEGIGLGRPGAVVVQTDGTFSGSDHLTATSGLVGPRLTVVRHAFDAAFDHADTPARWADGAGLSHDCRICDLMPVCGGGLRAHRYRSDNGFDNPSVYCRDLAHVIRHIRRRLRQDVQAMAAGRAGAGPGGAT